MTDSRHGLAALSGIALAVPALVALLLAGCADAPGTAPGRAPVAGGAPASDAAPVAAPAAAPAAAPGVPLPPGTWRTAYSGKQEIVRGTAERMVLVSESRGVVDRVVLVYRVHLGLRYEFQPRESCRDPSYYHQVINESGGGAGDCWHVRAVNLGLAGEPHWVNLVLAFDAERQDLFLPAVMPGVRFIRYAEGEMLQVDYLWNPDLLLPAPAGAKGARVWEPDDWTNKAVAADPAKQAVMRTLQRWGEDWQARLALPPRS